MTTDNTDREELELLPCPFCGAAAVLRYEGLAVDAAFDGGVYGRINCSEVRFRCCPELQFEPTEQAEREAIVEWNSRATVATPQEDAHGPLRAAIEIAETYRAARDGWRNVPTRHEIQDIISKHAALPADDGCSIVLHQTDDGHHYWLCPNCKRENISRVGMIDLKKFLPSVICCECGLEFGVDKSALPATTEERSSIMDNDDDDDYKQRQVEIEDDLRCGHCGSAEAGNCIYCKTD